MLTKLGQALCRIFVGYPTPEDSAHTSFQRMIYLVILTTVVIPIVLLGLLNSHQSSQRQVESLRNSLEVTLVSNGIHVNEQDLKRIAEVVRDANGGTSTISLTTASGPILASDGFPAVVDRQLRAQGYSVGVFESGGKSVQYAAWLSSREFANDPGISYSYVQRTDGSTIGRILSVSWEVVYGGLGLLAFASLLAWPAAIFLDRRIAKSLRGRTDGRAES